MYCYARLLSANEEGLNHTLSYIDGLGTRGSFFSELDEDLSTETVKKVLRIFKGAYIESSDQFLCQSIIFCGAFSKEMQPRDILREVMLEYESRSSTVTAWIANSVSNRWGTTKIHLLIFARDQIGEPLLLSEAGLDLLHTLIAAAAGEKNDAICSNTQIS